MIDLKTFKSGKFLIGAGYKYFVPNEINTEWVWQDSSLNLLLEKASLALGMLNALADLVPNVEIFIQSYSNMEAVISSKIEGTQTHIDESFLSEDNIEPERKEDWMEVKNYSDAMANAIQSLAKLPISTRLILQTHRILLQGVRGMRKSPGEYRSSQNWIGGRTISDAVFIPPHHSLIGDLMGDLEKFIHNEEIPVPNLIKVAILHYQFETIHPFLDGNGRIGRLLITLFLMEKGILTRPLLYLSTYFEKNRSLYYDNLMNARLKNNIQQWIKYFLSGIIMTADDANQRLKGVLLLKIKDEKIITETFGKRVQKGLLIHEQIFRNPYITVEMVMASCKITHKAASELIQLLMEKSILGNYKTIHRKRFYVYVEYTKILFEGLE